MGSPSNRGSLYFTSIRLKNWRNFLDIDVPLQQRVFLVGPNASGKSNFLDAFRFLSDIVTVGGGFQEAVVINRGGISRLRCLSARRVTDIVVQVRIGSADGEPEWEYELHFSQDSRSKPIIKREIVFRRGERILNRPDDDPEDRKDPPA